MDTHAEKSGRNRVNSNWNQVVFTMHQIGLDPSWSPFAVPNQSENGKHILTSVWFNTISNRELNIRFPPLYAQINIFEILLNKTEIRLYLSFSSIDSEQQMFGLCPFAVPNESRKNRYNK